MAEELSAKDQKKAEREARKAAKRQERERKKAEKQAAKDADAASTTADEGSGGGSISGIRQWLLDSYNGIFKIVIQPQLPKPRMMLILTAAFIFGIIWAYVIFPVSFFDAAPYQLSASQRDQYAILVAGAYQAELYADENIVTLLGRIEDPAGTIQRLIEVESGQVQFALQQVLPLAQQAGAGIPAPNPGDLITSVLQFIIATIVFLIAINLFALAWGLLIGGIVERTLARFRPQTDEDREAAKVMEDIRRRKQLEAQMLQSATPESSDLGPAIMNRISPYTKGRPYDDSFAIEDANDMFLGECGATIAKTIGDSQELTAIEIWLFDKEDFVRTLTKIFASEHAFNDPVIRADLNSKVEDPNNDIIMITPGGILQLETAQLLVQAKVADLQPGTDPSLPPNSHFESLTLQMQAWEKGASAVVQPAGVPAAATAASGLPDLSSYEIGPPPEMPSGAPASSPPGGSSGGLPDLSSYEIGPPPELPSNMQQPKPPSSGGLPDLSSYEIGPPPEMPSSAPTQRGTPASGSNPPSPLTPRPFPDQDDDDEDDPFGGSADFTPINR